MIELSLTVQVVIWLVVIGIFLASGQASLFHPVTVYCIFHGLVFVLRPILVRSFGFDANWNYMIFQPTDAYFIKTLAVSSVALIVFATTCVVVGWAKPVFLTDRFPGFNAVERRALLATTLLLLPAVAYSIYATRNGIEGERVNGIYIMTNSTGYLNEAQHFAIPLLGAWLVATRFHWFNLAPISLYVGYRVWFGWSRWTILLFLLMTVLVYCWFYRRKWIPLWSIVLAIPVLALFNLLGHNRDLLKQFFAGESLHVVEQDVGMSRAEKIRKQLDTQDYANFDYLSYVVSVVPERTEAFSYGAQYLQLFTEPIPRILWKGKPVGAPVKMINIGAYGNFVGLTVSICGDGWISGGWVGLVITLAVAGALLGGAHRWFWRNTDNVLAAMLYLVALAMVPQWYRDGGISIFKFLLFNLFPVLVWMGMNWLMGPRLVASHFVPLPPGAHLRFIRARPRHAAGNNCGARSRPV
ncbi:MAG TPA: hypothetical protein VG938_04340 [Verrucomicrobiae bacterium]|jgi:hypothetical protein|nr:hypothetical protein [Verrucomicrobiae bacterium]